MPTLRPHEFDHAAPAPPPSSMPPPPPGAPGPMPHGSIGPGGRTLPSPWKRIGTRFLDGLILGLVFGSVFAAIVLSGDDDGLGGIGTDASAGKLYLLGLLGAAAGFVWGAVPSSSVARR
ncbi:MAG: RDD family protein [Ilumatobacteraceae bacterium]